MSRFVDAENREWELRIRVSHLGELKSEAAFDLGDNAEMEKLGELFLSTPMRLCNALWVLCRKQAEERKVTREQFEDGFDGDAARRAITALSEAIIDFFQGRQTSQAIKERLPKLLSEVDSKTATAMGEFADSLLTSNATANNSPESSASIQTA